MAGPIRLPGIMAAFRDGPSRSSVAALVPIVLAISAAIVWIASLGSIDVHQMNDYGLVSVLPLPFYFAVGLLTFSFCMALREPTLRIPVVFLHILILIFVLFGTTALVEDTPRFEATWKHLGIVDYIRDTGTVNTRINAYFNWPGFFALAAFVTEVSGYENLIGVVAWSHVFFNLLFLAPLVMIFGSITRDQRLVWLALWFFYLTNWVAQDYFSPQAFAYFLYLVIVAILLRWFKPMGSSRSAVYGVVQGRVQTISSRAGRALEHIASRDPENTPSTPFQRMGLITIAIAAYATMVPSHQLTPIAALFVVAAFIAFGRITPRGLLILMTVMVVTWMFFMAVPYFRGHLDNHLGSVGTVDQNVQRGVTRRFTGSPEHVFVVHMRTAFTVVVGLLAVAGALRRIWKGYWDLTLALLVLVAGSLVATQGYGGEMLIRVYFFALPGLVFFAAALFHVEPRARPHWITSVMIGVVSIALFSGFLFARYGNERMDYFSSEEFAAVRYLYDTAEPGSVLIAGTGNLPWKYQEPAGYRYERIASEVRQEQDLDGLAQRMRSVERDGKDAYLIITRSTKARADLFSGLPPGSLDEFEQSIKASPRFDVIYSNLDATIFTLADRETAVTSDDRPLP